MSLIQELNLISKTKKTMQRLIKKSQFSHISHLDSIFTYLLLRESKTLQVLLLYNFLSFFDNLMAIKNHYFFYSKFYSFSCDKYHSLFAKIFFQKYF